MLIWLRLFFLSMQPQQKGIFEKYLDGPMLNEPMIYGCAVVQVHAVQ